MEDKVIELLRKNRIGEEKATYLAHELLLLFSAGEQRESLLAVAEYVYNHFDDSSSKTAKDYLQDFISQ